MLGPTLVGPLVLLNLLGAGLLVEPPEKFLVVEWSLLALKKLVGSHSTSLDSVLSFSRNIQRCILLMCTTLDLSDFLCSIYKVTRE